MKILVICQYYYPVDRQITPICEQLVKDGYMVTVLTGLPNYPMGIIPDEYKKKEHRDEIINGVRVVRCYEIGRGKGPIRLAINYASFAVSSILKVNSLGDDFDLVFVYQLSPVLMGLPGIKYAVRHKVPLLLYCCDIWPESMKPYIANEKNLLFRMTRYISKKIYLSADKVLAQSTSFIPYLKRTHGIEDKNLTYLPAFADETYLTQDFTPDNDITDFVFLGNLGIAQNLIAVLEAVKIIRNIHGFKVHFVGDGSCLEQMKKYVHENKLEDIVVFHGRKPVEDMPQYYKLADACLVSLYAENETGLTLPSKVQGYMAAGKPIIGMIDGSAKEVIEESGCGECVSVGDIKGLANIMRQFIENKEKFKSCGENGRHYFKENFRKQIFMNKLEIEIYRLVKEKEKCQSFQEQH